MNTDHLGVILCRAVGLSLLILGFSAILPALIFGVRPGWTSYAPLGRGEQSFAQSFVLFLRYNLPYVVQVLVGVFLLLFSHPLGRLLARGLFDHVA